MLDHRICVGVCAVGMLGSWASAGDCRWQSFAAPPLVGTEVMSLVYFDDGDGSDLYAGGWFPGGMFQWTGLDWASVGLTLGSEVRGLATHDDGSGIALYAAGLLGYPQDEGLAERVLRWDGQAWEPVGEPMSGSLSGVASLDTGSGPRLYTFGGFQQAGSVPAANIAMWDGQSWAPLGSGLNEYPKAAVVYDDGSGPALYVAGFFTEAGGLPANRVAKWDGTAWTPLGSGMNSLVNSLAVHDDGSGPALYAGGFFTQAGGTQVGLVARWDGSMWTAVGEGLGPVGPSVTSLYSHDDGTGAKLYAGGAFTETGTGSPAAGVAVWDGAEWEGLGSGVSGGQLYSAVNAFASGVGEDSATLFMGGRFTQAGGLQTGLTAQWVRCRADLDGNCEFNFFDISAFSLFYLLRDPVADFTGDGLFNFFDFAAFLDQFNAGCG